MTAGEQPAGGQRNWHWVLAGISVALLVFVGQSWPYWRSGLWLAGTHADGPFHFYCQLSRIAPDLFSRDLAVQSNQSLGYYETTYRAVGWLALQTGWPLIAANLVVCWLGNLLYLAGVMALLRRLQLSPFWGAVGTLLVAQPFVLISMSSGVVHSLAIPREFWLWPLPWLVLWFAEGRRDGWRLTSFYAVLGAVYGLTYPLWAALFGMAFGLADGWRLWREQRRSEFGWLVAGGVACVVLVAAPALGLAQTAAGAESAVLDYNQISRSVYFSKGFRRLVLFSALGLIAFRALDGPTGASSEALRRLRALLLASLGVCLAYEPFQRFFPTLSLLYLGRLSLVAFLISMVAVAWWLGQHGRTWQPWIRGLAAMGVAFLLFDSDRRLFREWRAPSVPAQEDFVQLCQVARNKLSVDGLGIVPPDPGSQYFRVYAERGLWIHRKDGGVLSRTRALYREAGERLKVLDAFYEADTSPVRREELLAQMQSQGVTHVVTKADAAWAESLSWPVLDQQGLWQLRAPTKTP